MELVACLPTCLGCSLKSRWTDPACRSQGLQSGCRRQGSQLLVGLGCRFLLELASMKLAAADPKAANQQHWEGKPQKQKNLSEELEHRRKQAAQRRSLTAQRRSLILSFPMFSSSPLSPTIPPFHPYFMFLSYFLIVVFGVLVVAVAVAAAVVINIECM